VANHKSWLARIFSWIARISFGGIWGVNMYKVDIGSGCKRTA
jgi:hypothetical protein